LSLCKRFGEAAQVFSIQRVIWRFCRYSLLFIIIFSIWACQPVAQKSSIKVENQVKVVAIEPEKVVMGQMVYVPVYSQIYQHSNRNPVMNLSATLSIRNTDLVNSLIIRSVDYYNNNGELIKTYLENPIELKRLSSVDYLVETEDTSGGLGANFIMEWVATINVTEPVIEALMLNTAGNQGLSFISPGRVIKRQGEQPAAS
jgi:hypothetical protein